MNSEIEKLAPLTAEVKLLINTSRQNVAIAVNSEMTLLYWNVGKRINDEVLGNTRAEYGKQVVTSLAKQLVVEYGKGWGEKHLRKCMQFALTFPDRQIVATLRRQLTWSHFRVVIPISEPLKRSFYIEMCKIEKWSSRQLQERIQSMLYERTAISRKPDVTIQNDLEALKGNQKFSADLVFKDPYFLDFLGLNDTYSEKDLESSIVVELQRFIIEMGNDFAFMSRQKRLTIDSSDYYMDLLFFHRRLRAMVVIEIKLGKFEAAYKGQMELYLRYLEKYEMLEGENPPIGLILCAGKNDEHVELMQLNSSNIRVAEYLTALPSREILQQKFHQAIDIARQKLQKDLPDYGNEILE